MSAKCESGCNKRDKLPTAGISSGQRHMVNVCQCVIYSCKVDEIYFDIFALLVTILTHIVHIGSVNA